MKQEYTTSRLPHIIQILPTISYGDAIGNDCLAIRDCLTEAGYGGDIYAEQIDPKLQNNGISGIKSIHEYQDDADILICHVSVAWDYMLTLGERPGHKIFIYHNITPPHFFKDYEDPAAAERCGEGLKQLKSLRLVPSLCLADSAYNKAELEKAGYLCPVHVLPVICQFREQAAVRKDKVDSVNILFVGRLAPNKKQHDILEAFYIYHKNINPSSRLILLGGGEDDYAEALKAYPRFTALDGVTFTGHVSDSEKDAYYRNADVFLCLSEHEGFCVPLLEAMHYEVPIIAYKSSAVTETLGGAGLLLERKEPEIVAEAIDMVMTDEKLRGALVANGRERLKDFAPENVKALLLNELKAYTDYWKKEKTLFFDVTVQRKIDAGTGVQRVEKEELKFLYGLNGEFKIVPFYFDEEGEGLFDCETGLEIPPLPGDIIYSSDISLVETPKNTTSLDELYTKGVKIWFFVHDLIPIRFPETCDDALVTAFSKWLTVIVRYTGIIGNSKATIDDVKAYFRSHPDGERSANLTFGYSWLGCDFSSRCGIRPATETEPKTPCSEGNAVRLLMVSTVEPRKMQDQAVQAFDLLRKRGVNVRLDIVGREGWKVEKTVRLIESSPNYGTSLFWHKGGISDEELDSLYKSADAVLVPSKWEGFGLAVTEGVYYGKPLIIRDIPVFREIAGDNAFYFSGFEPENLADAVEEWISLFSAGKAPASSGIHLTSWQEHGEKLLEILTGENQNNRRKTR